MAHTPRTGLPRGMTVETTPDPATFVPPKEGGTRPAGERPVPPGQDPSQDPGPGPEGGPDPEEDRGVVSGGLALLGLVVVVGYVLARRKG